MSDDQDDFDNSNERPEKKKREIRRERRAQHARERLGPFKSGCLFCGESNPLVLERHHVAGREFHADTVIVCRNHHRLLSDLQNDHPAKIYEQPCDLERIAHHLAGTADMFELLAKTQREFVKQLTEKADDNSGNVPDAS